MLEESRSVPDTSHGLQDSAERLKSELEKAQKDFFPNQTGRGMFHDAQNEMFAQNHVWSIYDDPRLFPTQNVQTARPTPQVIPR